MHSQYQPRTYRSNTSSDGLVSFRVVIEETDVFISADVDLTKQANDIMSRLRGDIKKFIYSNPEHAKSLAPIPMDKSYPDIVKDMIDASNACQVGPMAAVAGAVAEAIGKSLLRASSQIIVENGGDIFISSNRKRMIGVYAGDKSKFSDKLVIQINPEDMPCGVCTSSAVVGHSLSFGCADAVVTVSPSCALADACATALCNRVKVESDIDSVIEYGRSIKGITGILIAIKGSLGVWGNLKLV
jgi:uncharacterized protein